ncbi:hypothetical protein EJ110_NYTH14889 [Nymphaea thermarum]|nr:hypothetical protein EJ110_NYTH14889 [Nymphaea thermarum]
MELDNTNEEPERSPITTNDTSPFQDHPNSVQVNQSLHEPRNNITTRRVKGKDIIKDSTENRTNLGNPFYQTERLPTEIPPSFSFKSSSKHQSQSLAKAPHNGQEVVHNVDPHAGNFQILFSAGSVTHSRGRSSRLSGHRKCAQETVNHSFADPKPIGPAGKRKRVSHCWVDAPSDAVPPSQTTDFPTSGGEVQIFFNSGPGDLSATTLFKRLGALEFLVVPWNCKHHLKMKIAYSGKELVSGGWLRATVIRLTTKLLSKAAEQRTPCLPYEGTRINDVNHIRSICDEFFCAFLGSEQGSGRCLNKMADGPRLLLDDNVALLLPATFDEGDPMSPYLVLVVMEELSRNLEYRHWNGFLTPPYIPRIGACPSLLTFADDLIIFSRGDNRSYNEVMDALQALQLSSGLCVNLQKSLVISFGEQIAPLSFISNSNWMQGRNSAIHKEDTSTLEQDSHAIWWVYVDGFYTITRTSVEDRKDLQVWLSTGIVPDKCPRILTGQACLQLAYVTSNGRQLIAFLLKDSNGLYLQHGVQWWEANNELPKDAIIRQLLMDGGVERFQNILLISKNKP